jgi:hypothetical protein
MVSDNIRDVEERDEAGGVPPGVFSSARATALIREAATAILLAARIGPTDGEESEERRQGEIQSKG